MTSTSLLRAKRCTIDGITFEFADAPPPGLTSIFCRRFTGDQIEWLGDQIIDLLLMRKPGSRLECIAYSTTFPAPKANRIDTLIAAASAGGGIEIAVRAFPGFGDEDA